MPYADPEKAKVAAKARYERKKAAPGGVELLRSQGNLGIGKFKDDPAMLQAAADYLTSYMRPPALGAA